MTQSAIERRSIIRRLLPEHSDRLLDIGSGPVNALYPYRDKASHITCIDWRPKRFDGAPAHVECLGGDFTRMELPEESYDAVVAADVFEHILLEEESRFADKCISVLKPGGHLILSVPHRGTFAWLDPYGVKPALHRLLWRLRLYHKVHNGHCDVRKGHKHYRVAELRTRFESLELLETVYTGYLYHPLLVWAHSLSKYSFRMPFYRFFERKYISECGRDYGERSFAVVLKFRKPDGPQRVSGA